MSRRLIVHFCIVLLLAAALFSTGCGRKVWPSAQQSQDRFSFEGVTLKRDLDCAFITATVVGNKDRLRQIAILIEENGCETCPFLPIKRIDFRPHSAAVRWEGDTFTVVQCGLKAGTTYRFKLVGVNQLDTEPLVSSQVLP